MLRVVVEEWKNTFSLNQEVQTNDQKNWWVIVTECQSLKEELSAMSAALEVH